MSQSFSNNIASFNTTNINFNIADDRPNILDWLSPLDPKSRHMDIQGRRVENVGEWLLQTEQFRRWHAGSGGGVNPITRFCFAMEIRGLAKLILSNKGGFSGNRERASADTRRWWLLSGRQRV